MSTRTALSFLIHTATTEIYTLSLHDALPISRPLPGGEQAILCVPSVPHPGGVSGGFRVPLHGIRIVEAFHDSLTAGLARNRDRKSTRLNSSHRTISYAVFCLKKKNQHRQRNT